MTSQELNEILNKTRRTKDISLTPEQVEELVEKLEVLEILKEAYENGIYIIYGRFIEDGSDGYKSMLVDDEKAELLRKWKNNASL